jgi:hypothetical protein
VDRRYIVALSKRTKGLMQICLEAPEDRSDLFEFALLYAEFDCRRVALLKVVQLIPQAVQFLRRSQLVSNPKNVGDRWTKILLSIILKVSNSLYQYFGT